MSLLRKIRSMIKRVSITLSPEDTGGRQLVQITYLGKSSTAEVIWPYGMSGRLPAGAEGISLNIEGMEENKSVIGTLPGSRIPVDAKGEVNFGNPLVGTLIYFKEDGTIEAGSLEATFRKLIDERFIAKYNAHVHPDPVTGNSEVPTVQLVPGEQETEDFGAS